MRILSSKFGVNPTKIEQEIRRQMIERQQAHDNRNLSRKLTILESKEKKDRKLFDSGQTTQVSLYRITLKEHPQNRYKLDINAVENRLSGVCLINDNKAFVLVEGCSKSLCRFHKLITRRINWNLGKVDGIDFIDQLSDNKCKLIWSGTIKTPHFDRFRIYRDLSDGDARKLLRKHNAEQYWDLDTDLDI